MTLVNVEKVSVVQRSHLIPWHAARRAAEVAQYNHDKRMVVAGRLRGRLLSGLDVPSQSHLRSPVGRCHLILPPSEVTRLSRAYSMPQGNSRVITVF